MLGQRHRRQHRTLIAGAARAEWAVQQGAQGAQQRIERDGQRLGALGGQDQRGGGQGCAGGTPAAHRVQQQRLGGRQGADVRPGGDEMGDDAAGQSVGGHGGLRYYGGRLVLLRMNRNIGTRVPGGEARGRSGDLAFFL